MPDLVIAIFTVTAGSIGAVAAVLAIYAGARFSLYTKMADVIMACNSRYDQIYRERTILESKPNLKNIKAEEKEHIRRIAEIYYSRFWGLKSDQFDYWLAGFVDPETISTWFASTMRAFGDPKPDIDGISFKEGWLMVAKKLMSSDPVFVKTISQIAVIASHKDHQAPDKYSDEAKYLSLVHLLRDVEKEQKEYINIQFGNAVISRLFRLHSFIRFSRLLDKEASHQQRQQTTQLDARRREPFDLAVDHPNA